jgi:hypothetical protein
MLTNILKTATSISVDVEGEPDTTYNVLLVSTSSINKYLNSVLKKQVILNHGFKKQYKVVRNVK